jgi:phosphoinositide-3-kinase regulatory subunit 4
MCAVQQCHSVGLTHGNIKPENILVNSYNWVFLSDIATNKPILCKDDNLEIYNKFFGELSNNNRCYLAPERWRSMGESSKPSELHPSSDIFSMGCVIAEILMEGMDGHDSFFNL